MTFGLIVAAAVLAAGPAPSATTPAAQTPPTLAQAETRTAPVAPPGADVPADADASPVPAPPAPSADGAASSAQGPDQAGEIVVVARQRNPADPIEKVNLKSFEVTQKIDDAVTAPLAHGYEHAVPRQVRGGIHNLLSNLHEPVVFVNFLLQHKVGKAAETVGRFAINSTIGIAGVLDVAKRKPFNLPRRPNGFADTLGFYGVKPGAFMFLPLMGPTTVRDLAGGLLDRLLLPAVPGTPFRGATWTVPTGVLHTLDKRIEFEGKLAQQRASIDPYAARRDYYLAQRQAEIDMLHGKPVLSAAAVQTATFAPAVSPASPQAGGQ